MGARARFHMPRSDMRLQWSSVYNRPGPVRASESSQAHVVFAGSAASRRAVPRRCLCGRASILKFECFEPGKIGASG